MSINLLFTVKTEMVNQFENCAVVVGLNDVTSVTNDFVKISLHCPNEVSMEHQLPTNMQMEATAAVYCNMVYVTGIGANSDEIWKYSSVSGWEKCACLVQSRRKHSAAFIDEVLYICGGYVDSNKSVLDSVEAYNAVSNKCTTVGKLVRRCRSSGNCVPFRKSLYIFGGIDTDGDIPSRNVLNPFGRSDRDNSAHSRAQVYNTSANTCTLLSKPLPRSCHFMQAILLETSVMLLGLDTCLIFNFETEKWQERKQFKTDVVDFGLVLEDERVFVMGGVAKKKERDGTITWKCRNDIRSVSLKNIIENKSAEWRTHATLSKPCLVQASAKIRFSVYRQDIR